MQVLENNKQLNINKFGKLLPQSIGVICANGYDLVMPGKTVTIVTSNQNEISLLLKVAKQDAKNRYLGFVQGKENGSYNLFRTGVLCRLTQLKKDKSGKFIAKICGVTRFDWKAELLDPRCSYRVLHVDYSKYMKDLYHNFNVEEVAEKNNLSMLRLKLIRSLSLEAEKSGRKINWGNINKMDLKNIIAASVNSIKLSTIERQAILDAKTIEEQAKALIALVEISRYQQSPTALKNKQTKADKEITLH